METQIPFLLQVLFLLQLKHLVIEYLIYYHYLHDWKHDLNHPVPYIHATCHALLTFSVLLIIGGESLYYILFGEFFAHLIIGWIIARVNHRNHYVVTRDEYWRTHGIEQFLKQMTYLVIIYNAFPGLGN